MEELSEAELLKDVQRQQSAQQLSLLTGWNLALQEGNFQEKEEQAKGEKPCDHCRLYQQSSPDKFQNCNVRMILKPGTTNFLC